MHFIPEGGSAADITTLQPINTFISKEPTATAMNQQALAMQLKALTTSRPALKRKVEGHDGKNDVIYFNKSSDTSENLKVTCADKFSARIKMYSLPNVFNDGDVQQIQFMNMIHRNVPLLNLLCKTGVL